MAVANRAVESPLTRSPVTTEEIKPNKEIEDQAEEVQEVQLEEDFDPHIDFDWPCFLGVAQLLSTMTCGGHVHTESTVLICGVALVCKVLTPRRVCLIHGTKVTTE